MMIKYNNNNVHAMPFVTQKVVTVKNKSTGKKRQVTRANYNLSPSDIPFLRPGWNEFPRQVWEQNKNHPGIQKMLEEKKIELMNDVVQVKVGKKTVEKIIGQDDEEITLKYFSDSRAVEIVKGTLNRDILQRWMDEETRHKVKRAITKQIEPLLNKPEKDSD
jgi:hypothetical protein